MQANGRAMEIVRHEAAATSRTIQIGIAVRHSYRATIKMKVSAFANEWCDQMQ